MTITTTQLKENQAHWLSMASREDIIVTKNGKFYVRITGARAQAVKSVSSLFGIIPSDVDERALLAKRVTEI
ncbi:MAG: type II toxin-antitoxin system prevent-host-death family antitoxin [Bacilli bacterium]|nr:type II toxin-antitoxin system prevent-host-death family antitoxin [Bacilli bacterium]